LIGPGKTLLSADIKKKPYRLLLAGEEKDIYVFDGVPFKYVKTLSLHSNFINKVSFNPSGDKFVSVSNDKSINLVDASSLEVIK